MLSTSAICALQVVPVVPVVVVVVPVAVVSFFAEGFAVSFLLQAQNRKDSRIQLGRNVRLIISKTVSYTKGCTHRLKKLTIAIQYKSIVNYMNLLT